MKHKFLSILLMIIVISLTGCNQSNTAEETIKNPIDQDLSKTNNEISNQIISVEELSKHSTDSDCWVAFQEETYDITEYLGKHKGSLTKYCGTSESFESAFTKTHKDSKINMLKEIGTLKGILKE